MSAAEPLQVRDGEVGRSILPFASASRLAFQRILEQLIALEPQILTSEPGKETEEELFKLWHGAKQLERHEWVIKCYSSAGLWDQTAAAKRGRGNKDIAEKGILAAVSKKSKKLNVTPSTIYLNARIFRLIKSVLENVSLEYNILDLLDERGYWENALLAADPTKAILEFASKKSLLPRFRVTDAQRLVMSEGMSRKSVALKAVENARVETGQLSARETLITHIRMAQDVIRTTIIPTCPDETFNERVWEELLTELEEEYQELFDQDACDALRKAWDKGAHREDGMVAETGFPLADVSRCMKIMSDLSEFIRIQPRDVRQRSPYQLWHKVGEIFDNARFLPMTKKG